MRTPSDELEHNAPRPRFATTQWSLIAAASEQATEPSRAALEQLCQQYWQPLYAWLRQEGSSHEDAEDIVQSFLLETIESRRVERADPNRGRFRTFLLASLKNYRANWRRNEQALKRGGNAQRLPLDFSMLGKDWPAEPRDHESPDRKFDRKWALCLIENSDSQQQVAAELGLTVGAIRVALHRWREDLRQAIREEIRQTVIDDREIDEELGHLMAVLSE